MKKVIVKLKLLDSMLGSSPSNGEVYADYIAANAPDAKTFEEEVAEHGVVETMEKGTTVFNRASDGTPCMLDYQLKGFFKDAVGMQRNIGSSASAKLKNYKKKIDGLLFVYPRHVKINFDGDMGLCQRPLRAQTMQGERVALACSEEIPAGAELEFIVIAEEDSLVPIIEESFRYGLHRGLGQWRNSGKGRFKVLEKTVADITQEEADRIAEATYDEDFSVSNFA